MNRTFANVTISSSHFHGGSNGQIQFIHAMTDPIPHSSTTIPQIPIEIVSEEEMAFIDAALAAAAAAFPRTHFHRNAAVRNITLLSKRSLSTCSMKSESPDIEDCGSDGAERNKKVRASESLLRRFRNRRGLSITDITGSEWCEKQTEFQLLFGKPKRTAAMKAGSARHLVLEEEVIKRVKIRVDTAEDVWALKFINFIVGTNQLLLDGLTRELPVVGFVEGVWMVGIIDELRMPLSESERLPILVDTKTRAKARAPSEPQKRNGRLQLMCYKYLWDTVVTGNFPTKKFFEFFSLNPNQILSSDIRQSTENAGFPSQTLNDLVMCFGNSCCVLPCAHDQLLLRYELQEDQALLGEDEFAYEPDWLKNQIKSSLEFWMGEREANYPSTDERWKCRFCKFAPQCPVNSSQDASLSQITEEHTVMPSQITEENTLSSDVPSQDGSTFQDRLS